MKVYKLVVMGPGGVGKTALIVQFVSGHFIEKYDPTIEDYYRKEVDINHTPAVLEILDTAGTDQFAAMRDRYIQNGEGFMLVYSVINQQSFFDVQPLRDQIVRVKGGYSSPIMLVGNKCDMEGERTVSIQVGEALAQAWGSLFKETSAKRKYDVQEVFVEIAKMITPVEENVEENVEKKSGCCVCL